MSPSSSLQPSLWQKKREITVQPGDWFFHFFFILKFLTSLLSSIIAVFFFLITSLPPRRLWLVHFKSAFDCLSGRKKEYKLLLLFFPPERRLTDPDRKIRKMEKTLTRLKSNLKSRRKLSLPMLVGQFHQHWNGQNGTDQQQQLSSSNGPKSAESEEILLEDIPAAAVIAGSSPEDLDCSDDESALGGGGDLSGRSPMGKAWLSFGRSRRVKGRNKPRRWPSTPAFMPTTSSRNGPASPTGCVAAELPPLPSSLSPVNGYGGSSHNLTAKASTVRPQPYIQGYHLTLPSFLSNRGNRSLPQQPTNQSQRNRQMQEQVFSPFVPSPFGSVPLRPRSSKRHRI